jgi:hypothetical protein
VIRSLPTLILAATVTALIAAAPAAASTGALSLYETSSSTQWVTSGTPAAGDTWESVLGFLQPTAGPTTAPLYECLNSGLDRFLNLGGCGSYDQIDLEGDVFSQAPADQASAALYRCNEIGSYHFASTASGCGGATDDGPLGAVTLSAPLTLYAQGSGPGPSWATTGPAPGGGFSPVATLGYLVSSAQPGTIALDQCLNGSTDHFLSIDDCEGQPRVGVEGAIFGSPPAGLATVPVYRCSVPGSYHFASNSASCDGQHTDGLMGYALTQPLPPPAPASPAAASSPAASAPVSTPVGATAAPARGSHRRALHLRIALRWTWNLGLTRLRAISIRRAPRGTTLSFGCAGRGCPFRLRRGRVRTILRRGAAFRWGDRLTLTVIAPGHRALRVRVRIRYARLPVVLGARPPRRRRRG